MVGPRHNTAAPPARRLRRIYYTMTEWLERGKGGLVIPCGFVTSRQAGEREVQESRHLYERLGYVMRWDTPNSEGQWKACEGSTLHAICLERDPKEVVVIGLRWGWLQ